MAGDHNDPMTVRKNVYVEGIANYRDQIHERFFKRLQSRNVVQFGVCAFVVPAFIYAISAFTLDKQKQRYTDNMKGYKMPQSRKETMNIQDE